MPTPEGPDAISSVACEPCREQHLRCDRGLPSCARCLALGRQCIRGFKFKLFQQNEFAPTQKWPEIKQGLKFVQESGVENGDQDGSIDGHDESRESNPPVGGSTPRQSNENSLVPGIARQGLPEQTGEIHPRGTDMSHGDHSIRSTIYLDKPIWPLECREEAKLFRHYGQNLAVWLDLCDPDAHFQTSIPSRAGTCPILLNAIFALSARHLAHTSKYDSLASNRYHEQCLKYLIPLLDHAVTISDENLFAATIILRVLEEMEVPTLGQDTHGHLLGIHAFVAPLAPSDGPRRSGPVSAVSPSSPAAAAAGTSYRSRRRLETGSLSAACFWTGLRQEIYSAVMNEQSVRMNLAHEGVVDRSTRPADDYVWANRAIVHCADVLNYCFGSGVSGGGGHRAADSTRSRWEELDEANRQWKASLPASYMPMFYRERHENGSSEDDGGLEGHEVKAMSAFPEVWYWKGCHIIAVQHHILAELYIALFDPSLPRSGAQRRKAEIDLSARATNLVRHLCGIGICNRWCPPGLFTACMGIAAAGDRFEAPREQRALLAVLSMTEREHARPTSSLKGQLMRCWRLSG